MLSIINRDDQAREIPEYKTKRVETKSVCIWDGEYEKNNDDAPTQRKRGGDGIMPTQLIAVSKK